MARHKSKPASGRNVRLADQIQKDLAELIQREIDMSKAGLITLTGVDLSADYAHAKVHFTVLGAEPDTATEILNTKAGWFHSQLYKMLHIHTVPTLRFFYDDHVVRGMEMSKLIEEANRPFSAADLKPDDDPDDRS
ncbi:MAG TPA: 30S ribosome-binding factor RbfA [Paenalcaligenes hominis]|uniref:Ribosome-binding factor A n=1 Tax=Paenalcaligenes hominis TaxID=643674 RepID=A0A9D2VFY8_9BURK|nr:30S ribosome-binding factor RbfA [Paenalcaligenes hominis]NJB66139.1 ribosome-binding factor A [Paenalcaligenes hominis]GGE73659.1 ribosome-binding factor A [Paenalcaligenes hominis]HJH24133.1 30S ribosome-binding factor RbfA [Paenalcaligenes hominis]